MTTTEPSPQVISASPDQLESLIDTYLKTDFPGRRPATTEFARMWVAKWLRWMKACHHNEVTYDNLQTYVSKIFAEYKPKTATEYWITVRRFLRWMVRTGRTTSKPHEAIRMPRFHKERVINPITREEYAKLREVAAGHWMDWIILLGWNTGMSIADCMMLKWGDIDLDKCIIRIRRIKTGTESIIPFDPHDELGRALISRRLSAHEPQPDDYVSLEAGERIRMESAAVARLGCDCFRYIAKKAGIPAGKRFHSMRHSFVSMLANSGMSTVMASKVSGHCDPKIFANYVHVDTEALRQRVSEARAKAGNLSEVVVASHGQRVSQINSYLWKPNEVYIAKRGRLVLPDGQPVQYVRTGDKADGKRTVVVACDESGEPVSDIRLVVDITDVRRFS